MVNNLQAGQAPYNGPCDRLLRPDPYLPGKIHP
jgi:hypothetical protein